MQNDELRRVQEVLHTERGAIYVIGEVCRRLYHAPRVARGADSTAFAGEGYQVVVPTIVTAGAGTDAATAGRAVAGALWPVGWCEWGLPCDCAVAVCMVQRPDGRGIRHTTVYPFSYLTPTHAEQTDSKKPEPPRDRKRAANPS